MTPRQRVRIAVAGFVGLAVLTAVALLTAAHWIVGQDQAEFLEAARQNDARIARMYELYPDTKAGYNDGNRSGRRGAFAPIVQTLTLSAELPNGYVLKLYRGIGPDRAIVEGAYGLQWHSAPKNAPRADLTEEEFDALLEAKGDVGILPPGFWGRAPLPAKNL